MWRWLHADAIRPWQHRTWIFPRDPAFAFKAGRMLDLYARQWQGRPLDTDDFVLSTDETTSIEARVRIHPSTPAAPGQSMRVEHEYTRGGAWAYLAALDVHRGKVFGRCEPTTGIAPLTAWSRRSWASLPIATRAGSSGSWTTARRIAARPPSSASARRFPRSSPYGRSTPVG